MEPEQSDSAAELQRENERLSRVYIKAKAERDELERELLDARIEIEHLRADQGVGHEGDCLVAVVFEQLLDDYLDAAADAGLLTDPAALIRARWRNNFHESLGAHNRAVLNGGSRS